MPSCLVWIRALVTLRSISGGPSQQQVLDNDHLLLPTHHFYCSIPILTFSFIRFVFEYTYKYLNYLLFLQSLCFHWEWACVDFFRFLFILQIGSVLDSEEHSVSGFCRSGYLFNADSKISEFVQVCAFTYLETLLRN